MEWTDSARQELQDYLERTRSGLKTSDADAQEVIDDLKRHVEEEAALLGLEIVTKDDIARILAKMGNPDCVSDGCEPPLPEQSPSTAARARRVLRGTGLFMAVVFGVLLPAFVLGFEFITGMCAETFFDPIPTIWHMILIGLVPLANGLALWSLRKETLPLPRLTGWLTGVAIGVSLYYAFVFLPISFFAVIAVLYMGIGFLPLSPILSMAVAISMRARLNSRAHANDQPRGPAVWKCILMVMFLFILLDIPKTVVMVGTRMAVSENEDTRVRGIKLLRALGSEEILLKDCYISSRPIMDSIGFIYSAIAEPLPLKDVQAVYYRVTGNPYNAVQPPELRGLRGGVLLDGSDWDYGQAGDEVSARVRGLSLQQSRVDTIIDPAGAVSYTEWIMVFHNSSVQQREARGEIRLPPGAVVSRLTLWIDGEEREAAYGGRAQVKTAYKKVVTRRRDPVLVTTSGPDQVLMQCFPVPPNGGTMKLKVGITAPLVQESFENGLLRLPYFCEQNFNTAESFKHSIWIESPSEVKALCATDGIVEESQDNVYTVRGDLAEQALMNCFSVRAARDPNQKTVWAPDHRGEKDDIIVQTIEQLPAVVPKRVVAVIDGSGRMEEWADDIAETFSRLSGDIKFAVLQASDRLEELSPLTAGDSSGHAAAAETIADALYAGGCDNVPALVRAWEMAAGESPSAIIWIHGPQPIELDNIEGLRQKWERRPGNPLLYDLQIGRGPNRIAKALDGVSAVRRVPRFGNNMADLARLLGSWSGKASVFSFKREKAVTADAAGTKATTHVTRLWAYESILRLAGARSDADIDKAVAMGRKYLLVTPVTGAVVLETQQQYDEAGLDPADRADAPAAVPEPETWALMIIGLLLITATRRKKCRQTS